MLGNAARDALEDQQKTADAYETNVPNTDDMAPADLLRNQHAKWPANADLGVYTRFSQMPKYPTNKATGLRRSGK